MQFVSILQVRVIMNRKLSLILLFVFIAVEKGLFAAAPPLQEWQKCIGGLLQDIPSRLIRSQDGNSLLLSNVDSKNGDIAFNHGSTDIWLSKLDPSGNIIWQKSIGGSSIDIGTGLTELNNGNFIISGYTSSSNGDIPFNKGNFDVLLICANSNGDILWTKIFGGAQVDLCYSMLQTSDGGFVLGGGSYSNDGDVSGNHGDQDFWVLKTDSLGNLLWQQSSGGSDIDVCYSLAKDKDENIFACGTTKSSNGDVINQHGNYDLWVIKYDPSGKIKWSKTYGGTNYETAQTILIDSHQKILIGGYTRSNNSDVIVNYGYGDSWIIQIDEDGNLLKQKNFGGSGSDNLYSIIETADGGYLLTSGTTSRDINIENPLGQEDIWLYKTDVSFNKEWSHNYGGSGNDRPLCVLENPDGGFLLSGYTFSNNIDVNGQHGSADIWLLSLSCKVPIAFYSTDASVCLGDTLNIINASSNASQSIWLLNNVPYIKGNTAKIYFTNTGFYQLNLNVQTCYYSSDLNTVIEVVDCKLPVVNFSAQSNSICANSSITFMDASKKASSWQWHFPGGNPSSSTLQNPEIIYNQPGTYNVMLTASNDNGSQTVMRLNIITVIELPAVPIITLIGNELSSTLAGRYQWYFNNTIIPNETSQNLTADKGGFYKIEVWDNNQCSNISDPVYFSATGISEDKYTSEFTVFPNPATSIIHIALPINSEGVISIIGMNGQKLLDKNITKQETLFSIDLTQYSRGIYKVLLINEKGKTIQKSIIIN